ncbi:hypothetical protein TURU_008657 [Turdus rufiventris]|nr:hypothetical protein TURU_008657 [Turdus rufiventris]
MNISDQRPQMLCTLAVRGANPPKIQFRGLIHTGMDVTDFSPCLASHMADAPLGQAIAGVGDTAQTFAADKTRLPQAKVFILDLTTYKWEGPHDLIDWGRGDACVSTNIRLRWLPARCVRPDLRHQRHNVADAQLSNADQHANHQPEGPSTSRG